jgi:siroheme synthase-like protein
MPDFHLPLVLAGASVEALVVGAGRVALRRTETLLEAGSAVRVVAPEIASGFSDLAARRRTLTVIRGEYTADCIGNAHLIFAATGDATVNARVASDALARWRLVNVVDAPELGNIVMPAIHRTEDLVIAVSAGGAPRAAAKLRDIIARRFDSRYGAALRQLAKMRRRLLDGGERERWHAAAEALVTDDFCEAIESGAFSERMRAWG